MAKISGQQLSIRPKSATSSRNCSQLKPGVKWLATFRWVAPGGRLRAGFDWRQGRAALLVASPSCLRLGPALQSWVYSRLSRSPASAAHCRYPAGASLARIRPMFS